MLSHLSVIFILLTSLPPALTTPTHDPPSSPAIQTLTITAAPSAPSTAPSFLSPTAFTSAILNSTNTFRAAHNATALAYNTTLALFAAAWASSTSCEMKHSGGPYGENLAIGCSDVSGCVDVWGEERGMYDFGRGEFSTETGHFTQLVWKGTREVGCGRRECGEMGWLLVCEYWPRGNVLGRFVEEVQGTVNAAGRGREGLGVGVVVVSFGVLMVVVGT